jgi:hypothetical protein
LFSRSAAENSTATGEDGYSKERWQLPRLKGRLPTAAPPQGSAKALEIRELSVCCKDIAARMLAELYSFDISQSKLLARGSRLSLKIKLLALDLSFTKLKVISLASCSNLVKLRVPSTTQELNVSFCGKLQQRDGFLRGVTAIRSLNLNECKSIRGFAHDFSLTDCRELDASNCTSLFEDGSVLQALRAARMLFTVSLRNVATDEVVGALTETCAGRLKYVDFARSAVGDRTVENLMQKCAQAGTPLIRVNLRDCQRISNALYNKAVFQLKSGVQPPFHYLR